VPRLRKSLPLLFQERKVKPRRADDSTRWRMAILGRVFRRRDARVIVKPDRVSDWCVNTCGFDSFTVGLHEIDVGDTDDYTVNLVPVR
jgi:hypothetical protein